MSFWPSFLTSFEASFRRSFEASDERSDALSFETSDARSDVTSIEMSNGMSDEVSFRVSVLRCFPANSEASFPASFQGSFSRSFELRVCRGAFAPKAMSKVTGVTVDSQLPVTSRQSQPKHLLANRSQHAEPRPAVRRNPRALVYFVPLGMVMNGMVLLPSM
jgi:hypothetical protein